MPASWISRGTVLIQLGRHHFAFFRGYLNGLDLKQLVERYIETDSVLTSGADQRAVKSPLIWIIDQLTITARRTGNAAAVRAIRMAPEKLAAGLAANVPNLEEFREERDPHQMFSERELLQLFEEEYGHLTSGAERRLRRNKRLRDRQIAVLNRLEALVDADPRLEDEVGGWLDPAIAKRLVAAGIRTIDQLVKTIEAYGFRWYTKVPRIGIKAAGYITEWLLLPETARALGVSLSIRSVQAPKEIDSTMSPALPRRKGVAPLEQFDVPQALSGAFGNNRRRSSSLSARDDLEAIDTWLSRRKPGSHTWRAYRKEAERFLLWSVLEAGKALSSLTMEDCISYRDFLWRIGREPDDEWNAQFRLPQREWIGPRGINRFSSRWRPFEGALSESSQRTALVILHGMMRWLCDQNYLQNNPFKTRPKLGETKIGLVASRTLTIEEWEGVKKYLGSMAEDQKYIRLRFILTLAYMTGCRLSELAVLQRGDLLSFDHEGCGLAQWEIVIVGKGGRIRRLQLSNTVIIEVEHYFQQRGYRSFVDASATAALIANVPTSAASLSCIESPVAGTRLSAARIYKILKTFFTELADATESANATLASRYRSMSPHWLRHTFAKHGIQSGIALETIRDLLGHRALSTTSLYVTSERGKPSRDVGKLE